MFHVSLEPGPAAAWHLGLETLAYFVGFRMFLKARRAHGDVLPDSQRYTIVLAAAVGALVGSKVLHHLSSPARILEHWREAQFWMGGKTIVGGLLGGLLAVEWTKRQCGIRTATGDLFAVPLCFGIALGRVGCFLSGSSDDTAGGPSGLPWAVDYGAGPRHPTALYEVLFMLVLAGWLTWLGRRPQPIGRRFRVFLVSYLAFRFCVDFLKPYQLLGGLRGIQWACLAGLGYYAYGMLQTQKKPEQGGTA